MNIVTINPLEELKPGDKFDESTKFQNGKWYNPIKYYMLGGYNINDGGGLEWEIVDQQGIRKICYKKEIRRALATLCYGELEWKNYEISVCITPHTLIDYSGIAFRYVNSRCYYALMLGRDNKLRLVKREHDNWQTLCDSYEIDITNKEFVLKVVVEGEHIDCFINGLKVYSISDDSNAEGCVGLVTYSGVDYHSIKIKIDKDELEEIEESKSNYKKYLKKKYTKFPRPKLYKKIKTSGYNPSLGAGLRIVDTDKGQRMLFIQAKKLEPVAMVGNVYDNITCITVTNMEGEILWQRGKPGEGRLTGYCCQVCDIDNDGKKELIATMNFEIIILDFETGDLKKKCPTPLTPKLAVPYTDGPEDYYPRICGDHIYICDLKGKGSYNNFLIKDRYNNVWAYDSSLRQIWHMHFNTGHFPYAYDVDNDGIKEILLGHRCISADGNVMWMLPLGDHVDNICVGDFEEKDGEPRIVYAAGEEGFVMTNLSGRMLVQKKLGHIQKMCIGHFTDEYPGQQFIIRTLWGDQGLIYTLDSAGNVIKTFQKGQDSKVLAVNWIGNGLGSILHYSMCKPTPAFYNFSMDEICKITGLEPDKRYRILIKDLLGDSRDEIVISDENEIRFYTQDDNGTRADIIPMKRGMEKFNYSAYKPDWLF